MTNVFVVVRYNVIFSISRILGFKIIENNKGAQKPLCYY